MNFSYEGIALIPIITLIVNLFKKVGLPCKWAPIFSLILGIVFGVFFLQDDNIRSRFLLGIIMGTSASGLYSNGKEIAKSTSHECKQDSKNKKNNV